MKITLVQGDITEQNVDAIVNAANHTLMGGGGVDGAIHRRGGPEILAECKKLRESRFPDGLPTGEAVATTAGRLKARWVIHTSGRRMPRPRTSRSCSLIAFAIRCGSPTNLVPRLSHFQRSRQACIAGRSMMQLALPWQRCAPARCW
jgi:hypothetical protein